MGKKSSLALMILLAVFLVAVLFVSVKEDRMVPDIVNGMSLATGARCDLGTVAHSYWHSTIDINLMTVYDPTNPSDKLLLIAGLKATLNGIAALNGRTPQLHNTTITDLVVNLTQHGSAINGLQRLLANTQREAVTTEIPANYRGKPLLRMLTMPQLTIAHVELSVEPFGLKTTAKQLIKLVPMRFHFTSQPINLSAVIHKVLAAVTIQAKHASSLDPNLRRCFINPITSSDRSANHGGL